MPYAPCPRLVRPRTKVAPCGRGGRLVDFARSGAVSACLSAASVGVCSAQLVPGPIFTGPDDGLPPQVKKFDPAGNLSFFAYAPTFTGGVRVAAGDVNGDGVADIITGAGPGAGPHVKVFNGANQSELASFFSYGASFTGGVFVAAGDLDGDGRADIITGAGAGAGPHVKVFSGRTGAELRSFFAYPPQFTGGVRVAAGDVNGDGFADIITGAGAGAGPHVKVFDGRSGIDIRSFFAYAPQFTGGVFVAAGDLDGDGLAEIITGAGAGAAPHVKAFNGKPGAELHSFFAYPVQFTGGVRVAVGDVNGDTIPDLITGVGAGGPPEVKAFHGQTLAVLGAFMAYDPAFTGGVFVAGSPPRAAEPALEIDLYAGSLIRLTVRLPDGSTETVLASGRSGIEAQVSPDGDAADTDGDGLDQVAARLSDFDLDGNTSAGPVKVRLRSIAPSAGEFEESANTVPGRLDLPPFAPAGTANGFFDVFFELQLGTTVLHNGFPAKLSGPITEKPAATGESFSMSGAVIDLLDANNNPTGLRLVRVDYVPKPETIEKRFFDSQACLGIRLPNGTDSFVPLTGEISTETAVTPSGAAADTDADGRDQAKVHLTHIDMSGKSAVVNLRMRLRSGLPSAGEFEESANSTPGTLDVSPFKPAGTAAGFFDVFVELDVAGTTLHHNEPITVRSLVTHIPPAPGEYFTGRTGIELLDPNGNPTGFLFTGLVLVPNPAVPVMRRIGVNGLEICWPATAVDHVLECSNDLKSWLAANLPEIVAGEMRCATTTLAEMRRFYRLRKPDPPPPPPILPE